MSDYILTANGEFYSCDELYHYGIPGMKWGKRKASYEAERAAYKQAKRDYKEARRDRAYANVAASAAVAIGGMAVISMLER